MFFLIWGFKVRFTRAEAVTFACPRCGVDRAGHRGVARRWFTFFFIPTIPLNVVTEYVGCDSCDGRFDSAVLSRPTTAWLLDGLGETVRLLTVAVLRAGGESGAQAREAAVRLVTASLPDYDVARLEHDLVTTDLGPLTARMTPLAEALSVEGKERVLTDLVRLALTAGSITAGQRQVFTAAGFSLGMTQAHVDGVIAAAQRAVSPQDGPGL